MEICDVCGRTDKECRIRTIKGMKLCPKHVTQYYRHGKFQATITKDYKTIYLGTFNTYEDAMFAKELAKSQYWS